VFGLTIGLNLELLSTAGFLPIQIISRVGTISIASLKILKAIGPKEAPRDRKNPTTIPKQLIMIFRNSVNAHNIRHHSRKPQAQTR
jgi:hypothetical protein